MLAAFRKIPAWLLCFAAGAATALAFAPYNFFPVLFITLPLFFVLLQQTATTRSATLRSFLFGYGYFMAGTWWIANALLVDIEKFGWLMPFSILGLSGVMALWFAVLGFLFAKLRTVSAQANLIRFAVLWVVVEYLRSLGQFGFPWNLLGTTALAIPSFAQAAALVGPYGLGLLVLLFALTPVMWRQRQKALLLCTLVLVVMATSYGVQRVPPRLSLTDTYVRLVQPSIPQSLKADPHAREEILAKLLELTHRPAAQKISAVLWAETALPYVLWPIEQLPPEAVKKLHLTAPLITGVVTAQGQGSDLKLWNSIVAIGPDGKILGGYSKHQLVPFGEFVPLRNMLPLDKITPGNIDFSRGEGVDNMIMPGLPAFSSLICYEVIFPFYAARQHDRPQWMLNVTNDGWYGDTAGPYQHLAMARMRAIEQGLPLARVANNGISAMIDPYGRLVASIPLESVQIADVALPKALDPTLYVLFSEAAVFFALLALWLCARIGLKNRE